MICEIGITGYTGRMGQSIAEVIRSHPEACLIGGVTRAQISTQAECCAADQKPRILTNDATKLFPSCDAIIDFSHASATAGYALNAADAKKPFMSGTTGLDQVTMAVLHKVAQSVPVLYAANTSLSLVVVRHIIKLAAQMLKGKDYDISIMDKHHRWKKDAPSGTALALGQSILSGNGGEQEPSYVSIRAGSIVGEHEILFAGAGENIAINHLITDRRVFARGAVEATLWLAQQKPGFYTLDDMLGVA